MGYVEIVVTRDARVDPADSAFLDLVGPHWEAMARLAQKLAPPGLWEDVLQDALAAAWRKQSQFDRSRGQIRSWLFAIVADQSRKGFRGVRRHSELDDVAVADPPGRDVDIDRALRRLSPRQRATVVLHYFFDLPVAEVGQVLGCSAGTVKSTLSDARAKLRRDLGEQFR
jgi:DNA-directed RNA polymerase specialized sigma24 family protein